MKEVILKLLKEAAPAYLSGEDIAGRLKASRTAVWKNIKSLQKAGYDIEGSPRLGYRLLATPDLLYPAEICEGLGTEIIANNPSFIYHYIQLNSTNDRLKLLAEEGAPEGTVVFAEEQTAGKGRLGRTWSSPRSKGIWLSVLLRPTKPLEEISVFTLLTAVAVARSINKKCPGIDAGIKWPNDILIKGRKVCGILTELKAEADRLHYLITGIGLNYSASSNDFPPELEGIATSILLECNGLPPLRKAMARGILREMDSVYQEYLNLGTEGILQQWKDFNITLGQKITIKSLQETFSGVALDIDRYGALIVESTDGEQKRFVTGEITTI
jgi:BirA family biotin operon repressor/biotin-[acetyl-CoA-carboxylase] ligase